MLVLKNGDYKPLYERLENRFCDQENINETVMSIIKNVQLKKDSALMAYTKEWDSDLITSLKVTSEEFQNASKNIEPELLKSLEIIYKNITEFHKIQKRDSKYKKEKHCTVGEIITPLESVGIYVPGGKASYPSTVMMNAVPAKIAGVKRIVMVTPPQKDGTIKDSVLVAAMLAGVDEVYKVGGAQSIAALTYGTESILSVDKIVGPGNIFVATAKKIVSDRVGIDMIAGPSEILILSDDSSNPAFIAADMIAQAEHDERASAVTVTTSLPLIKRIQNELIKQVSESPRNEIVEVALENYGAIIYVPSVEKMIEIANTFAPEHLEILTQDPERLVPFIKSAGAIFVGPYSPEALGDYYAGPNHTLPTSGTARFASPLSVDDFIKKTSFIHYSYSGLKKAKNTIMTIAKDEGLFGHANSIKIRFQEEEDECETNY